MIVLIKLKLTGFARNVDSARKVEDLHVMSGQISTLRAKPNLQKPLLRQTSYIIDMTDYLQCPECGSREQHCSINGVHRCIRCGFYWTKDTYPDMSNKVFIVPTCPECGSKVVTFSTKLNKCRCRRCGNTWDKPNSKIIK